MWSGESEELSEDVKLMRMKDEKNVIYIYKSVKEMLFLLFLI